MKLKQIIAAVFILAFAVQCFNQAFVVCSYYVNKNAYAKNCENKAKPQLHCNGKCQMMKKMKETEKKEQQNPNKKLAEKNNTLSSKSFFASINLYKINGEKKVYPKLKEQKPSKTSFAIFHPPSIVT